mgnify:CR=1 FL=1
MVAVGSMGSSSSQDNTPPTKPTLALATNSGSTSDSITWRATMPSLDMP